MTLNAHVSLIDAIIDRFGMDVKLTSVSDEVCSFTVPSLFKWLKEMSNVCLIGHKTGIKFKLNHV